MSHIRSGALTAAGNAASRYRSGACLEFARLSGERRCRFAVRRRRYFTTLFLHHYPACRAYFNAVPARESAANLRRICAVALCQRRLFYAVFTGRLQPKNSESQGVLFARSGITPPTREMWAKAARRWRWWYYNQNLQVPPTDLISYINHATSSIHPIVHQN